MARKGWGKQRCSSTSSESRSEKNKDTDPLYGPLSNHWCLMQKGINNHNPSPEQGATENEQTDYSSAGHVEQSLANFKSAVNSLPYQVALTESHFGATASIHCI